MRIKPNKPIFCGGSGLRGVAMLGIECRSSLPLFRLDCRGLG
jgi:hypothetical protein